MSKQVTIPEDFTSVVNIPSNSKSDISEHTVSFGGKSNYQSELPNLMVGFKFNPESAEHVISLSANQHNIPQQNYIEKPVYTEVISISPQIVPKTNKNRPLSVTPSKRRRQDASPEVSRPTSAVRGRSNNQSKDFSVTNIPGMAQYIEKKSIERSFELKVKTTQENKNIQAKGRCAGKVVLDTANQRKQIERQVATLENRIKKLQQEEGHVQKKMQAVGCKTERALMTKMRHHEEAATKEQRTKKREESVQRRREEILKEKVELKTSVKKAIIGTLKEKYENAQYLKKVNEDKKEVSQERRQVDKEKKRENSRRINESLNTTKTIRVTAEDSNKKETNARYVEKANIEKERARELSLKCKELESVENEMLVKLSMTKSLFNARKNYLENISSSKTRDRSATKKTEPEQV